MVPHGGIEPPRPSRVPFYRRCGLLNRILGRDGCGARDLPTVFRFMRPAAYLFALPAIMVRRLNSVALSTYIRSYRNWRARG